MHEFNALGLDDSPQTPQVEREGDWIFGRGGKGNMETADRLQFARHFSGIGGHQRPRSNLNQGGGDRERRSFVPPDGDRRNDLEDRAPRKRRISPASKRGEPLDVHATNRRAASG